MALKIDPQDITDHILTWTEYMYLRNRGRLPDGYPPMEAPEATPKEEFVPLTNFTPIEEQTVPRIEAKGGIVTNYEEDYDAGWNNPQRRAELSKRGLSVMGPKDELIARLRRSDSNTLVDSDYSTLED